MPVKDFLRFAATSVSVLLKDDLVQALTEDPLALDLTENRFTDQHSTWEWNEDYLFYEGKIYVPEILRNRIIRQYHNAPISGHYGQKRTKNKLHHYYYWPNLQNDVRDYIH